MACWCRACCDGDESTGSSDQMYPEVLIDEEFLPNDRAVVDEKTRITICYNELDDDDDTSDTSLKDRQQRDLSARNLSFDDREDICEGSSLALLSNIESGSAEYEELSSLTPKDKLKCGLQDNGCENNVKEWSHVCSSRRPKSLVSSSSSLSSASSFPPERREVACSRSISTETKTLTDELSLVVNFTNKTSSSSSSSARSSLLHNEMEVQEALLFNNICTILESTDSVHARAALQPQQQQQQQQRQQQQLSFEASLQRPAQPTDSHDIEAQIYKQLQKLEDLVENLDIFQYNVILDQQQKQSIVEPQLRDDKYACDNNTLTLNVRPQRNEAPIYGVKKTYGSVPTKGHPLSAVKSHADVAPTHKNDSELSTQLTKGATQKGSNSPQQTDHNSFNNESSETQATNDSHAPLTGANTNAFIEQEVTSDANGGKLTQIEEEREGSGDEAEDRERMERTGKGRHLAGGTGQIPRGVAKIKSEGLPTKFSRPHSPQLKLEKIVVDEVLQTAEAAMTPSGGASASTSVSRCRSSKYNSPVGVTRIPTPMPRKSEDGKKSSPWCETCNSRLVELKRQAVRLWMPHVARKNTQPYMETEVLSRIEEKLNLPERLRKQLRGEACCSCETSVLFLKQEACRMLQTMEKTQAELGNMGSLVKRSNLPRTTPHYSPAHHRLIRQNGQVPSNQNGTRNNGSVAQVNASPVSQKGISAQQRAAQPQVRTASQGRGTQQQLPGGTPVRGTSSQPGVASLQRNVSMREAHLQHSSPSQRGLVPKKNQNKMMTSVMPSSIPPQSGGRFADGVDVSPVRPSAISLPSSPIHNAQIFSPTGSASSTASSTSVAASFFARAAQKLSRKKKKGVILPPEPPPFPTNFCEVIRLNSPPAPPCLLRMAGKFQAPGATKVKVMVRVCPMETSHSPFLSLDTRKKQISIYDPTQGSGFTAPSQRRVGSSAPKMFGFDALFSQDDSMAEMCSTSLVEIIQAVVNGVDGCVFSFGHARLGKTYTMIGMDDSPQNLGMIPCSIAWLFRLINEQKEKTGARFSVRVSAVEVTGKDETLKDLLVDVAQSREASGGTAPGVYLREDPISGMQVENQSELRAPSAERAAYYLDAAIASRTIPEVEEDARNSHLLFTLHVYQYRVDKTTAAPAGTPNVTGGRSRLHLIDLGSCSKSKDTNALSLNALGNIILALLNGQRNLPNRNSKLTSLIRDSLGNVSCRACMIAHISPAVAAYNETLQVVQLAARIHRMKRRRTRFSGTSSDDSSSCDDSVRLGRRVRRGIRMGVLQEGCVYNGPLSDPDYTSSSEQSCDTVIYVGRHGQNLSDQELTDNERPPLSVPIRPRPRMGMSGSRSSGDESDSRSSLEAQHSRHPFPSTSMLPSVSPIRTAAHMSASLPRKLPTKTESSRQRCVTNSSEQWIDGPHTAVAPSVSDSNKPEQWIDGPQAPKTTHMYRVESVPVKERTFSAYQNKTNSHESQTTSHQTHQPQTHTTHKTPVRSNNSTPQKTADHELWVDGPSAFYVSPSQESSSLQRNKSSRLHNKMLSDKASTDSPHRHKHHRSDAPQSTPEKHSRSKTIHDSKKSRLPTDTSAAKYSTGVSTGTDSVPLPASSQDAPLTSNTEVKSSAKEAISSGNKVGGDESEHIPLVKPFVRDWVEKHSALSSMDNQSPEKHSKSHRKHHHRHEKITKDDSVFSEKKKTSSPDRYVASAQSSPRVKHKKKSVPPLVNLPAASERTMAWVKSVHEATTEPDCEQTSKSVSQPPSQLEEPQVRETIEIVGDARVNSPAVDNQDAPPDYASVVESIENESLMEEDTLQVVITPASETGGDEPETKSIISEVSQTSDGVKKVWCNRESIYELQMDDQLETTRNSMIRLAVNSEDEFSWHSGSMGKGKKIEDISEDVLKSKDCDVSDSKPNDKASRPMSLRRPDGASNPNLSCGETVKPLVDCSDSSPEVISLNYTVACSSSKGLEAVMERSVEGQSPDACPSDYDTLTSQGVKPSSQSNSRPSSLQRSRSSKSPSVKPTVPSVPLSSCDNVTIDNESPVSAFSSNPSSRNNSPSKSISSPVSSPTRTLSPVKPSKESKKKASKDKESPSKADKSSSKSSGSRSRLPSFVRSRSHSAKKHSSSSKEVKAVSRSASRSPSPTKRDKKDKEKKEKSKKDKKSESRLPLSSTMSRSKAAAAAAESDSGNDSGIVKNDGKSEKLLSPYHKVTRPRISFHSSSGHGSDISSTFSGLVGNKAGSKTSRAEISSGYESMLRDSEASCSDHESSDEVSSEKARDSPAKTPNVKSQRSESLASTSEPCTWVSSSPSHAWVDTRQLSQGDEPLELQSYDSADVERTARRRREEAEHTALENRRNKIASLLTRQEELKMELLEAKGRLMVGSDTWSFDLHVAEHVDENDAGHLEALEKETSILEKRVEACKSRIMMVTCFDINV